MEMIGVGGLLIGIATAYVAYRQLRLMRDEARRNSRVNALIHIAGLIRAKISHHEQIIAAYKQQKRTDWTGHANKVNQELRPMLTSVHQELIDLIATDADGLDLAGIRQTLRLSSEASAS